MARGGGMLDKSCKTSFYQAPRAKKRREMGLFEWLQKPKNRFGTCDKTCESCKTPFYQAPRAKKGSETRLRLAAKPPSRRRFWQGFVMVLS